MKKQTLVGAILIILMSGCNTFLKRQESLIDFTSASTFYKTPAQIDEALSGMYASLRGTYSAGGDFWAVTEMVSDNTTFEYNPVDRGSLQLENLDYFMESPDNSDLLPIWSNIYKTISQCNGILDNVNNASYPNGSADKDYAIGQAEFVRALDYFNLVRLWGSVPLVLHQVTSPDKAYTKQSSIDSIYAQIINDVSDAAAKLPASWPSSNIGRATSGAAYTLLGEVYLTQKKFQDAINTFNKVQGYSLFPSYAGLFDPANKNNQESIFEIQYNAAIQGQASSYLYTFAPLFSGFKVISSTFDRSSGGGWNIPTRDMINTYESGDRRESASIAWFVDSLNITNGYVEAQQDSVPYINKYATPPAISGEQNNDFYVYRYANVLLWTAEATNELDGPNASAYADINQVRNRAGLPNLAPGLSQDAFRSAVWHEERVEEAFEDHRWFQLLRTGQALSVMAQNGIEQKSYQTWLPSTSYNMQQYMLLFPVPFNEVQLNNLTQNPGWPK